MDDALFLASRAGVLARAHATHYPRPGLGVLPLAVYISSWWSWGTWAGSTAIPVALTPIAATIQGLVKVTTTTGPITVQLRSEVAGSEVKVLADSVLRWEKVA